MIKIWWEYITTTVNDESGIICSFVDGVLFSIFKYRSKRLSHDIQRELSRKHVDVYLSVPHFYKDSKTLDFYILSIYQDNIRPYSLAREEKILINIAEI